MSPRAAAQRLFAKLGWRPTILLVEDDENVAALATEMVQQLECPIRGFRNTVKREQAKAAVEWRGRKVVLFKDV